MRFALDGDCLRAWAEGTSSFASTVSCWQQILAQVRAHRPRSLLLVDRLQGRALTGAEWESLVQATRGQGLEDVRIAHVKPHGVEDLEYCEIHAREVGLDARVFEDEDVAEFWLRNPIA
ncbi:MAG: hypothetical protein ACTHOC_09415 [Luteimonas sp.]